MSKIARYGLIILGWAALLLGLLGVILPILPTTPFLILSAACFSRSSSFFHQWLLNLPYVGEILNDWESEKKIAKSRKPKIYLLVLSSFLFSIIVLKERMLLQLFLIFIMVLLLWAIAKIDEKE